MSEDKVSKAIANNLKKQVAEQTNDIYNSLVGNKENSQLPEDIFQQYFLPHFSGQASISNKPEVMAEWISIAGTPTSEVDIIDHAGHVLFTVPSLFDTNVIDAVKREVGESISDIYNQYDLKSNNIPSVANNFLNKELSKKLRIVDTNINHSDITDRWNSIFDRYGIQHSTPSNTTKETDSSLDDDLIY
jgi:hypothetical protein